MRRFGIGAFSPHPVRRRCLAIVGAGVLLIGLILPAARQMLTPSAIDAVPPFELIPGVPYAVAVRAEQASFDLNFGSNTRYVVVVGSLGPAERRFDVCCSSAIVPATGVESVERVSPVADLDRNPSSISNDLEDRAAETGPSSKPASVHDIIPASLSQPSLRAAEAALHSPIPATSRSFSLHVTDGALDDPAQYVTIHATPVAEGRQVRVYLDDQQSTSSLAPGLARDVVDLFDRDIIPRFRSLLGTYRDVDHDGHFAVLLSPWLSRLQGGRTSVGGFVRGSDFQTCLGRPFSNRCDMMYMNSQTLPGPHLRTLLIHEYTHAVCFSRRTADALGRPNFPEEEDWLNEAIAHCAESLFGGGWSNLDYRIARFLNDPAAFPLVVGDYYRAGLWRCHGCRGATYLFLRYCLERFGPETLTRLIANPAHGTQNLELATGCSFEQLFRGWTLWLVNTASRRPVPTPSGLGESSAARPVLAPLDLYGNLGEWGLAGPMRQIWKIDASPKHIELRGTSAYYIEISGAVPPGPRRLCLHGPPGSQLQVSVVRLEEDAPRIEVEAAWLSKSSTAHAVPEQTATVQPTCDRLHAIVRYGSENLSIEQIAAEQNMAETHTSICVSNSAVGAIKRLGGMPVTESHKQRTNAVDGVGMDGSERDSTCRSFDLTVDGLSARGVPIVFKVVAADRLGHRTSAWAIVPPRGSTEPEHLAQHVP